MARETGPETLPEVQVGRELWARHLHGHRTPAARTREIHGAHTAGPQLPLHGIPADTIRQARTVHPVPHAL